MHILYRKPRYANYNYSMDLEIFFSVFYSLHQTQSDRQSNLYIQDSVTVIGVLARNQEQRQFESADTEITWCANLEIIKQCRRTQQ